MTRYLARRFLYLIIVLLVVTFTVSMMLSLPGDPRPCSPARTPARAGGRARRSWTSTTRFERYVDWVGDALHGRLRALAAPGVTVRVAIKQRLPVTLELVILAQALALLFAVAAGVYGANRPGRTSTSAHVGSFPMISTPRSWGCS